MLGNYTYCMKYGHDWSRWELNEEDGISVIECARCGARQVMFL